MKNFVSIAGLVLVIIGGIIWLNAARQTPTGPVTDSQNDAANPSSQVTLNKPAPDGQFTLLSGEAAQISQFKNQKIMLWLFATWCPTCKAGIESLAKNNQTLKARGVKVIALKTFGNAGFPGPLVKEFVDQYAPELWNEPNWVFGQASQELTQTYNPRNFPDIYFLIDQQGILRDRDGAPNATLQDILKFAEN